MNNYHPFAFKSSTRDKILGAIILLIIVFVLVWAFHYNQQINRDKWLSLNTYLSQSYDINRDAPIKLAGIVIGKVTQIDLNENNQVKVTIHLNKKYAHYYVQDSILETNTDIGVNTFLSGVSLNFVPGNSKVRLQQHDVLNIVEQASISQIIDTWDLPKISQQISITVENLARVSGTINDNQQNIESLIINMKNTSESLLTTSKMMPELISNMQNVIVKVERDIEGLTPQMNTTLNNLDKILDEATLLLRSSTTLTDTMNSTVKLTPATLDATNSALNEMQALSRQIKNHWLLRKERTQSLITPINNIDLPSDSSIYEASKDKN